MNSARLSIIWKRGLVIFTWNNIPRWCAPVERSRALPARSIPKFIMPHLPLWNRGMLPPLPVLTLCHSKFHRNETFGFPWNWTSELFINFPCNNVFHLFILLFFSFFFFCFLSCLFSRSFIDKDYILRSNILFTSTNKFSI